jgi:hypothetical protein
MEATRLGAREMAGIFGGKGKKRIDRWNEGVGEHVRTRFYPEQEG